MNALDILRPYTAQDVQQRAWEYLDRVVAIEGDDTHVSAEVQGTGYYDVRIRVAGTNLRVGCSCPYFSDRGTVCKHVWAVAILANGRGWLKNLPAHLRPVIDIDDLEDYPLTIPDPGRFETPTAAYQRAALAQSAPYRRRALDPGHTPFLQVTPKTARRPDWSLALQAVTPSRYDKSAGLPAGAQLLYVVAAPPRGIATELALDIERQTRKRNGEWAKPQSARLTLADIDALPDEDDRWALALVHGASAFGRERGLLGGAAPSVHRIGTVYLRGALLDLLLPRLCPSGRVRLRYPSHLTVPNRFPRPASAVSRQQDGDVTLRWDDSEPWRLRLAVTREDESAKLGVDAVLTRGEREESIHRFSVLTDTLAILDGVVSPFDAAGGFAWAVQLRERGGPIAIPEKGRRDLIDAIAASGVADVRLPSDLQWETRAVTPRFAIKIGRPAPFSRGCAVEVRARYDDVSAPLNAGAGGRLVSADGRVLYQRDAAAEQHAIATLQRLGVTGLRVEYGEQPSVTESRLPALVHGLLAAGWNVEAEGVRYRSISAPRLHISSGIDWFEIAAVDDHTATEVRLPEILKALSAGRNTVALGDGTIGMLPEEWLARVAPVLALGEASASGVRFKPSQVALIDALLAAQPAVDWDEGFARARDVMQRFAGVRPEDPPSTFHGTLREYQREALGWMRFLRDFGFGGCLADDMGLGKTVMVLAMLEARRMDPARAHKPSLIVLPRSLLFNWMSEAARFTPQLRLLDFAHADRHAALESIGESDLVLTTYGTLRRDILVLQNHAFDHVVLDEAQAIKNAMTASAKAVRLLKADHRLALTGTPVENHLGELQSLFDFLNPGLLGRGGVLDVRRQAARGDSSGYVARLAKGLRPFFLRRTKEQVAPELPPRTEETLYCELEGEQRRTYLELRDHYRAALLKKIERDGLAKSKMQILEALLRLRQAACHTGLLRVQSGRSARERLSVRSAANADAGTSQQAQTSAKFDLLLPRLAELVDEGRKALVFSQFTSLLALLRRQLDEGRIVYEYLDGQTIDRAERVARFQQDEDCHLFLISLKAGGVGLNLTAAEYVFLLDPWWNPAVEMQAIDRTHRIGQTKPVFAYRLVAKDTVEERILELQSRKRALADAILDAGSGGLRGLQKEDLEQLLS